jgi:hypothetical protein
MSNNTLPLDFFSSLFANGLDTYSVSRRYPNLAFSETGLTRFALTIGWMLGRDDREALAQHLDERLTLLNEYGGRTEDGKFPRFRVLLGDDRLPGSFALGWYVKVAEPEGTRRELNIEMWGEHGTEVATYKYAWNGGLILHGGGNETFTVRLGDDSNPWGIHT